MGGMKFFNEGLGGLIGSPDPNLLVAMEREHCESVDSKTLFSNMNYCVDTNSRIEWHFVVCPDKALAKLDIQAWPVENRAGLNTSRRRVAQPIEAFDAKVAALNTRLQAKGILGLQRAEVIGLRLYTGPMFMKYNTLLRGLSSGLEWMEKQFQTLCQGNTYTTTVHVINSALVKLGSLTKAEVVYRGISGGKLPEEFHKFDEFNVRGGVETAFMSTTRDRQVALEYAGLAPNQASMVMEIKMGMVDRGADLSWISQYPHEREICFPPLCGLEVTGTRVEDQVLVANMRPNVNMKAMTIEKVVARRKQMVAEMCEGENRDLMRELQSPMPQMVELRDFFGDRADGLLAFVADLVRSRHHTLSSEPLDFYNRNEKMSSVVTELVEFGSFVKDWSRGVKNLRKAFNPNQLKAVESSLAGTDAGSGGSLDLKYYGPSSLPPGYLLLGHGSENDHVLIAKGPCVTPATGWSKVWTNEGSKASKKYVVWMPTCNNPDYVAVGVILVFGTQSFEEPTVPTGLVHRSCIQEGKLGPVAWKDSGTGAKHDLALNMIKWGTTTQNLLWPSKCTRLEKTPPVYQVDFGASAPSTLSEFLSKSAWDLRDTKCEDMEAGLVAAMLGLGAQVHRLDLSGNGIGQQGAFALVHALTGDKTSRHLTELDISKNQMGDAVAPMLCRLLRNNTTLKKLHMFKIGLSRVGKSMVLAALRDNTGLEELNIRGTPVPRAELLAMDTATVELQLVPGRLAGTDAGSGGRLDLSYYEPENMPPGFMMLGHGGDRDNVLVAKGSMVKPNTGWTPVWTDAGSGKSRDYAVWLPTCDNKEYVALGVVCVFGTSGVQQPTCTVGLVHMSCCKPATLGHFVWSDSGTGARNDLSLNTVKWDGQAVNLMMPSKCTMRKSVPPAFAIREDED
eukprot:gb/GEZN01000677.1/.p1 GENE.gb/GEZN01000677.1/~~gb/GEZN01000677.1/.p1  ORF type:complete len:1038 (-),score=126.73 gb/GEZN01000677.1/:748-3453(-)